METALQEIYPLLSKEKFQDAANVGVDHIQAQLLYNRGVTTPAAMQAFLAAKYEELHDPLTLIDMPRALARIRQALEQHEHITVYGDYDADGVTSSALLYRALRSLKHPSATLDYHIPHRLRDGCGLNLPALDLLKARGTSLIVTTDCASSDVEQVAYAKSLGIDVVITDHHHLPQDLPQAYAMVNLWRPDCSYGERYLCGAGIAFKLVQALYRSYQRPVEDELALLDLVAIGTIGDIVPLLGENHTLVRLGMQRLNTTQKPGLKALIKISNLQPGRIRERDIAFAIAPRINAAGRMKEASIAFELLTTDNESEATTHAAELEQLNIARQRETEELMQAVRTQAQDQPTKRVVLVSGDDWHEGLIGLVAGKLADEIDKPVLVLSNDPTTKLSRGSARSRQGFNIIQALRDYPGTLERYGGHAQAAGFTIRSEHIEQLHEHLVGWQEENVVAVPIVVANADEQDGSMLAQADSPSHSKIVSNKQMIDLIFTKIELLNYELYKKIRLLGPFGASNPEPTFKMEKLRLLDKWPSGLHKQNLQLRLGSATSKARQRGTYTRGASYMQSLSGVEYVNIVFRLESSEDEVKQEVWLKILAIEPVVPE